MPPQIIHQLFAIVDAGIRGNGIIAVLRNQGLALMKRFGSDAQHAMAERHRPIGPR